MNKTFTKQEKIELIRQSLQGNISPSLIPDKLWLFVDDQYYRISSEGETVNVPESYFQRMNTEQDTIICGNADPPNQYKGMILSAPDPKKIAEQIYKLKNSLR